jgi:hypothetical protein
MIPRARSVGIVLAAMLTAAPVCFAADPGYAPSKGGIGGQIGGSTFAFDRSFQKTDYSHGAKPRFAFAAHFRYTVNPSFRWQVSPGFTWAGYDRVPPPMIDPRVPDDPDKHHYLVLLMPVSAQAQLTRRDGAWLTYLGAGPGVYRILVENQRHYVKDPVTFRFHRGFYAGATAQLGVERFMTSMPSVSLEFAITSHLVLAQRDKLFPSGFNSNLTATEGRIGINYYFMTGGRKKTAAAPEPPQH